MLGSQVGCGEECVVGAHGRARWALAEPEGAAALALRAPGGPRTSLALDQLPATIHLLYQNFIYVAFTATHAQVHPHTDAAQNPIQSSATSPDDSVLVLEVPLGSSRVVLGRKRYGDRYLHTSFVSNNVKSIIIIIIKNSVILIVKTKISRSLSIFFASIGQIWHL